MVSTIRMGIQFGLEFKINDPLLQGYKDEIPDYYTILLELFKAVFDIHKSDTFNNNGQYLYTYNDPHFIKSKASERFSNQIRQNIGNLMERTARK